jgi:group II intron reverse transcriptase/maturase
MDVSTKLQRIAKLAKDAPDMVLNNLAHNIDVDWLREAHARTRKDGATGVDRQTAREYAVDLGDNLQDLYERVRGGRYRAPPVRRVYIPKGKGQAPRPIGIPTFEDKVLQRAAAMVLEAVYEQDFMECSYGFRPGRSAHQMLAAVRETTMQMNGAWVLEVDIKSFFDTVDHACLRSILHQRVRDKLITRLIGKWLNAGALEEGRLSRSDAGTPQGGVISPLLANIYLHTVLDTWFASEVRPRMRGRAELFRYADDVVLLFEHEEDARRVMDVLPKRFAKYGLTVHPEKTKLTRFHRPPKDWDPEHLRRTQGRRSFDLLGFTLFWGKSRKGNWVVKWKTAKARFARSAREIDRWCRRNRHRPVREQHRILVAKIRGHYGYFGLPLNLRALERFYLVVSRTWRRWLDRRSDRARMNWERFQRLQLVYAIPRPRLRSRGVT